MKTREEYIIEICTSSFDILKRNYDKQNIESLQNEFNHYKDYFLGRIEKMDFNSISYEFSRLFNSILNNTKYSNPITESIVKDIVKPWPSDSFFNRIAWDYIKKQIVHKSLSENEFKEYISFFLKQGFTYGEIIEILISSRFLNLFYEKEVENLNHFGLFLKNQIQELEPKKGLLSFLKNKSENVILNNFIQIVLRDEYDFNFRAFNFLLKYFQAEISNRIPEFLKITNYNRNGHRLNIKNCLLLLEYDIKHKDVILEEANKLKTDQVLMLPIYTKLNETGEGYEFEINNIVEDFYFVRSQENYNYQYAEANYLTDLEYSQKTEVYIAKYLLKRNKAKAIEIIGKYNKKAFHYPLEFFIFLSEYFGQESISYLGEAVLKNTKQLKSYYHERLFPIIEKYDFKSIENQIWDFAENHSSRFQRELATNTLSKLELSIIPNAKERLNAKTVNSRIAGALVLSKINSVETRNILKEVVDTEKNDDTRDIIIESLAESLYTNQRSKSELQEIISFADKRGKLNKFNEKWLLESELFPIYWQEGGDAFSSIEVRFLFYRMNRAKGINSDIEARQIINAIDKEKSIKFTKQLIKAFADTGSDSKFKHYLTTAGQLGGNEILPTISSIFRQNMADKRTKMAEYTVEALGMIGSNKALRQVEVISRKFANKKPAISQKALLVLEAASVELNISADELSDRIIPDFDFEGLYKPFQVGDETYRAFINSDFSLCYFDEDNKVRKSLPKGVASEQKAEFKEIEKELKEVVKGQKGKFEKFLVDERRWTSAAWVSFFQEHPIMFVYARKLVWGIFDENQNLKNSFYCSDDTSLYDLDDDEVELQDGDFVGLVHPIYLDADILKKWKDKLYEMSLITIFPQMDRKVFLVQDSEKESNVSKLFFNTEIPKGADFVSSNVEKLGWFKSNSDGGSLKLTKKQIPKGISANIYIAGVMAWYQEGNAKATVYEVTFRGKNLSEQVLLKDLPPLFYSETMADIDSLINA